MSHNLKEPIDPVPISSESYELKDRRKSSSLNQVDYLPQYSDELGKEKSRQGKSAVGVAKRTMDILVEHGVEERGIDPRPENVRHPGIMPSFKMLIHAGTGRVEQMDLLATIHPLGRLEHQHSIGMSAAQPSIAALTALFSFQRVSSDLLCLALTGKPAACALCFLQRLRHCLLPTVRPMVPRQV